MWWKINNIIWRETIGLQIRICQYIHDSTVTPVGSYDKHEGYNMAVRRGNRATGWNYYIVSQSCATWLAKAWRLIINMASMYRQIEVIQWNEWNSREIKKRVQGPHWESCVCLLLQIYLQLDLHVDFKFSLNCVISLGNEHFCVSSSLSSGVILARCLYIHMQYSVLYNTPFFRKLLYDGTIEIIYKGEGNTKLATSQSVIYTLEMVLSPAGRMA